MKTFRAFRSGLVALCFLAACGGDPIEPAASGTLTLELVPSSTSPDQALKSAIAGGIAKDRGPRNVDRAGGMAARIMADGLALGTCDGCKSDSKAVANTRARPPLEAVEVRLSGPTNITVDLPQVGNAFEGTIENLAPGLYSVVVIGAGGGETTFFGTASGVRVVAGQNTSANVPFNSFDTVLDPFLTPTFAFAAPLSFSLVSGANFYQIEVARDANFTDIVVDTIPDNDGWAWFVGLVGQYFVRIRAGNQLISASSAVASNVETFEVVEDFVGNDAVSALDLGNGTAAAGTYFDLNIISGDSDYFRIGLMAGDQIDVGIFSTTLVPTSRLDPIVRIEDGAGTVIASNDNIDTTTVEAQTPVATVVVPGDYFIRVGGVAPFDVGHYEMDVTINGVAFLQRRSSFGAYDTQSQPARRSLRRR